MRYISVILFGTSICFAQVASFTTGQAARLVIGQTTFTSQDTNSSDTIIGAPAGVAYAANTLFVADSNLIGALPSNNRLLIYSNLSSMLPAPTAQLQYNSKCPVCVGQASVVLGQPNFSSTVQPLTSTQNNLNSPTAVASDGVHVIVADTNNNRVLIWNHIPTVNDQPADVVIGQPDFVTYTVASSPSAKTLRGPQGVWVQNGKLYIADTQNNRVLIYNQIPTSNYAAADLELGQRHYPHVCQRLLHHRGNDLGTRRRQRQQLVQPGVGNHRRHASVRGRSRLQPYPYLELSTHRQPGSRRCGNRPGGHERSYTR
jgi:hypothetical protein